MSSIGGPSGIGGGGGGPKVGEAGVPSAVDQTAQSETSAPSSAVAVTSSPTGLDALATEIAAGRLTPHEAIDQLVEATVTPGMDATERAELRELLADLVANDPYLAQLTGRI